MHHAIYYYLLMGNGQFILTTFQAMEVMKLNFSYIDDSIKPQTQQGSFFPLDFTKISHRVPQGLPISAALSINVHDLIILKDAHNLAQS